MNVYKVTYDLRTSEGWLGGAGALDSVNVLSRGDVLDACTKIQKRLVKSKRFGAVLEVMIMSVECLARGAV
jgi:hypothetical protein